MALSQHAPIGTHAYGGAMSGAETHKVSLEPVSLERRDGVLVAHLDDGKANALSFDMIEAIDAAVGEAEGDPDIAAVVLAGREGKFCAGFDLDVMRSGDLAAVSSLVSAGGALIHRIYGSGVPVVAACTGHALAAGALLLLGCDVRLGADVPCKIGLNEVAIGMVLPGWAMTIAKERISGVHLQRAVALAEVTDAHGAVAAGFLDEVAPASEVLDVAVARAAALSSLHRRAYAGTVTAMRGDVLARMADQIAADRREGTVPSV
jgi:enoyl-CoA hydratase